MNSHKNVKILSCIPLLLIIGFFIFHSYTLFPYTDDDAFISYRYAQNFANGYGLVFNKGETVEGYTNFLWTIMMSLIIKGGGDPVFPSKILGILFAIGLIIVTFKLSVLIQGKESKWNFPASLLLAASSSVAAWAGWGLETGFYSFLVALAYYLFIKEILIENNPFPLCGFVFFLAATTRPEGLGMFGLGLLYIMLSELITHKRRRNH